MTQDVAGQVQPPLFRRRANVFGPLHSGMTVTRFIGMHAMGAIFPLTAGVLLFGWRALGAIVLVVASTAAGLFVWRRVGSRGAQLRYDNGLWLAMLLAMTLPAHLFSFGTIPAGEPLWPILVAAGMALAIFMWLLGVIGSGRVHPVLVTYLLLFICFKEILVPQYVLQRKHIFSGDLFHAVAPQSSRTVIEPWIRAVEVPDYDARATKPASQTLIEYTNGKPSLDRAWVSLDALLRDRLPPLEDLIAGGHPAPIGLGSATAIIIGGLFLLYRGLIDYRVPLLVILSAAAAMLILPVPLVIQENGAVWHWFAMSAVDWKVDLTLVNYELMAGPLLFTAFFLATSPTVRPIARRARVFYAVLIGLLAGALQLYVSVAIGPYLALLAASLLTPTLDKFFKPHTLV